MSFHPLRRAAGLALLLAANKTINLTAVTSTDEAVEKHLLDSLTLLPVLAEVEGEGEGGLRLLDVGSGGGLPGLVLAICRPDIRVTLLDSTEKKCGFLRHAAREIGLENIEVLHARAETAGQDKSNTREKFDIVTARAVGRLAGHYHDTAGRAIENIDASLSLGLRVFDAAAGGLGGCPYAPGAAGNVATEAVAEHLARLGYDTGLDAAVLAEAAEMARGMRAEEVG